MNLLESLHKVSGWKIVGVVVITLLMLVLLATVIFGVPTVFGPVPVGEIQIGLVVVFAIVVLLILLTAMAVVFSSLNSDNSKETLGLPDGSIRALIAFLLIMIFIIMSVYLFRTVAVGEVGVPLKDLTVLEVTKLGGQIQISHIEPHLNATNEPTGNFDVFPIVAVTPGAEQLALQMITILGTLVTAVSAFYFGSATAARPQSGASEAPHKVDSITPSRAQATAGVVKTEIIGTGFAAGAHVKLRQKEFPDIDATDVTVVGALKITCTFNVSGRQPGQWDVVVINPDGHQAGKSGLFEIV